MAMAMASQLPVVSRERFGALLDGSQGDAMDDSGGQGFGGVFAGGASVEERTAGGGGRNHGLRLDADAGQGGASVLVQDVCGGGGGGPSAAEGTVANERAEGGAALGAMVVGGGVTHQPKPASS